VTPDDMVGIAIETAEHGLAAGELPIGAIVVMGDEIVGRSHTKERGAARRLVHADLLAMIAADEQLGWRKRSAPLALAVNLEPCIMCVATAITLGISEIYFALESPADSGSGLAATWRTDPEMSWLRAPSISGGIRRDEALDQFRRYCDVAPDSGFRAWAATLVGRSDRPGAA
jgi:tRNA(adenine34) deaminase